MMYKMHTLGAVTRKRMGRTMGALTRYAVGLGFLALSACGGGGGGSGTIPTNNGNWTQGVFQPSSQFAAQCARPRTGTDSSGRAFPDRQGTVAAENNWLRSWTNELYLWYDEVVDRNPNNFNNSEDYFDLMKTTLKTAAGTDKDRFHFSRNTAEWEAFAQSGVSAGYGFNFSILNSNPPRRVVVTLVEPNSPAGTAGVLRGDDIISIDGVDLANGSNVSVLNAGLFPTGTGQTHAFQVRSVAGATRTVTLTTANVTGTPVHTVRTIPTQSGNVGYILFNDHLAPAEPALAAAISQLNSQNIVDLVLDLRYNGGGYLAIASELAYMIAGPQRTGGQTFERTVFNNKHTATDPVSGRPLTPMPFLSQTIGLSGPKDVPLPSLNLPTQRVFILTSPDTCSASESIINGLRGVDFQVIQIGTTTCGKPYGFYDFDNCGTTYFSIQFQGLNAKNFGNYPDGFTPSNTTGTKGELVQGCSVNDDFTRQLGDPLERMLSVALAYRDTNACSVPPAALTSRQLQKPDAEIDPSQTLRRPIEREMRLYLKADR